MNFQFSGQPPKLQSTLPNETGWKRHLKVYHPIARSEFGLMLQILAGLITYLLRAIDCQENYNEKISISPARELRIQMMNESRELKP